MGSRRGPRSYDLESEAPSKIAVVRALKLGDLMCAIPAVRAIKQTIPHSEITLISLPWAGEFAKRFGHLFSSFIESPGWPGLPEQDLVPSKVPDFLNRIQAARLDLVIQMHGSGSHVNELVALCGARTTAGFYERGQWCPNPDTFIPYPANEPEVWRLLRLAEALGARPHGEHLEFPLTPFDLVECSHLQDIAGIRRRFVLVHPGAIANRDRLWAPQNFVAVGRRLVDDGFQVVLTGTDSERSLTDEIEAGIGDGATNVCGRTSLGLLGALVSRAELVICHDTGISHIAAALKIPSVVVFDRSEREGWPPADRQLHRFLCRFGGVAVEDVLKEIDDLLATRQDHAAGAALHAGNTLFTGTITCNA